MRFPKWSWRQKLIITSLLCLVLPSVITLVLTGFYTKNELRNKAVDKAEQSLEVADLYESNIMKDMVNAFNSIQYDSEMITDLRVAWNKYKKDNTGTVDFFSFKQITEKLERITFFGGKTYVTILLPGGLYFSNYSTYKNDLKYMYGEPWLQDLSKEPMNTTSWLGTQQNYVRADAEKAPNLVTIVRTFQLYNNGVNAYIILSKPEEQFSQIFAKYASDQVMMVLDAKGRIISHTDPEQIGQSFRAERSSTGAFDIVKWNGLEYISVKHPLPFASWSMQSLTPYESVTSKIGNIFSYVFVLQIIFFMLFAIVLFYFLNQWTKPIMRLARTAAKVEKGLLQERSKVKGQDEVGHLGLAFDSMLDRVGEMIHQIEWEQSRKRMAELELLQAQINPHFLFNTLNSIRLQAILSGKHDIADNIGSLSTLLRMTINRNNEFVPLHEEVGTIEHYMRLMNFRHSEGVELHTNLASDTLLESIPRFTLQPLVENAYIHGLQQKQGEISISAWKQSGFLYIQIKDSGIGLTEEKMLEIQSGSPVSGIGLKNVKERLQIIYGDVFAMEMCSSVGSGLTITLRIPLTIREENRDVPSHAGR
ncbi:sensor histidine kinase [Paenibacillus dokdonensis]|uniref:histidine kinase n=1 Tax=Paenibacillus dokdonensis TaxID=2567944 RepID=A0ABU6GP46_9BACL|nr:sensor histidine kinase [Paenibacillus dokdonensis]MEC0241198.1 sensor histidine kinase [Paenibacillus dokdonensis]